MDRQQAEVLEGTVEDIVFHNEDTGFTVMEVAAGEALITVVGEAMGIQPGEELRLTGRYVSHPTYGTQFKAAVIERTIPATSGAILKYLSGGAIRGIGPALARRIVDAFGDDTLTIMEKEPQRLAEVRGITPKKAAEIAEEYARIFGIRSVMLFLSRYGIDAAVSIRVWKKWGAYAPGEIEKDPYILCARDIGVPFEKADEIARQLGFAPDSPERLCGGILYVLRHNTGNGHCCLPYEKLVKVSARMLEAEPEQMDDPLTMLAEREDIISDTVDGTVFIYLPEMYEAETYCAGRLMTALASSPPEAVRDYSREIDALEKKLGIRYASLQRKAIQAALGQSVVILTGGPGTGKTTALCGMIDLLEQEGLKVGLAAPTGRAAKRMTELTGRDAKTIHRLLEVDFGEENGRVKFRRNSRNPLPYDAVIVDEMSMVDIEIFASLMQALRLGSKLIMVGDPDQLPSVGPGNVLRDLIDSDVIPVIHLTEVFRQAAESLIVTSAHAIVAGEMPDLTVRDNDFFFLQKSSSEAVLQTVVDLCARRLPASYGYSPVRDIQVISPTRLGACGTAELCRKLQEVLNPQDGRKTEQKFGPGVFREGDKVMQIRNNYDIVYTRDDGEQGVGVYNGDIGTIETIDRPSRSLHVRYDDRVAEYTFDMLDQMELAYAVTVHKSQGSEFDAVVMPVSGSRSKLFYRNLLYTAVTRAKKLLILVGQASAVAEMVHNDRKTLRYTNLGRFLREAVL